MGSLGCVTVLEQSQHEISGCFVGSFLLCFLGSPGSRIWCSRSTCPSCCRTTHPCPSPTPCPHRATTCPIFPSCYSPSCCLCCIPCSRSGPFCRPCTTCSSYRHVCSCAAGSCCCPCSSNCSGRPCHFQPVPRPRRVRSGELWL